MPPPGSRPQRQDVDLRGMCAVGGWGSADRPARVARNVPTCVARNPRCLLPALARNVHARVARNVSTCAARNPRCLLPALARNAKMLICGECAQGVGKC
ncbi:hypothetical protein MPTK1_8g10920 [Marchantia polymorpha subsp. ruderalis]|uniref:Uncharacterized protein n=1 Tax=Marchantia polymorpha TaxID=3197 RepID=A0A2R6XMM5_MARPO|nr:hypothetical protein MARPO_0008s0130 [Marchantia polymorpha]BBN19467.1 hypothetical protein Mp_8g10920 [Marchantia polymorpha subsp. ruderalis]|eukprot:PTQ47363.1 hypothetical protein MARPO_0008s0130 [Marchantia polymorpha]